MKELETKRLILRYLKGDDWRGLYDAWSDDEVTKYLTFDTYRSIEEAKERVHIWLDRYEKENYKGWIIERRSDGEVFGWIDVVAYGDDGAPEIGYLSRRRYWGCGYMTEALGAVTEYLFSEGYHAVVVEASVENVGSNRVIQKNGYTFTGQREAVFNKRSGPLKHTINSYRKER